MSSTAILLVIVSAVMHSTWSLLAKRAPKTAAFYAATNLLGLLFCAPLCVPHIAAHPQVFAAWPLFMASGVLLAVYYFLMYRTYRSADLSLAYPLLRISPIFITIWAVLLLGEKLSTCALVGIVATVIGCMMLPQKSLRAVRQLLHVSNYIDRIYLVAVTASLATSGYVLIDKQAMGRINAGADPMTALDYVFLEMSVCCAGLLTISMYHFDRAAIAQQLRKGGLSIFLIAPMLIGAWVLYLLPWRCPGSAWRMWVLSGS